MARLVVFMVIGLFALVDLADAQTRPGDQSQPDPGVRVEFAAGTLPARSGRSASARPAGVSDTGTDIGSPQSTPRICTNCDD